VSTRILCPGRHCETWLGSRRGEAVLGSAIGSVNLIILHQSDTLRISQKFLGHAVPTCYNNPQVLFPDIRLPVVDFSLNQSLANWTTWGIQKTEMAAAWTVIKQ
jgi:hypothetical protein